MQLFQAEKTELYAEVILPLAVGKTFTYSIPESLQPLVLPGKRVWVQFGKSKIYTGIIKNISTRKPDNVEVKPIFDIQDEKPVVNPEQLQLWDWLASYYCCFPGEVMSVALPSSLKPQSESVLCINPEFEGDFNLFNDREIMLLNVLQQKKNVEVQELKKIIGIKNISSAIRHLQESGAVYFREELTQAYQPKKEIIYRLHKDYQSVKALQLLFDELEKAPRQLDVILHFRMLLGKSSYVLHSELMANKQLSLNALTALVKKGILIKDYLDVDRVIFEKIKAETFELKDFQEEALNRIEELFTEKETVLLHGITSSGKTYIYIKLIEKYLKSGKQVLYLVPEISLTAQLIRKLYAYFGPVTGIYHSKYNPFERYETWQKVISGEYQLIVGVRSAVFLPFSHLGLIIIDEEHENTFKQQSPAPRYHARDTALMLSGIFKAKTLLGSATPSLESFFNARNNKFGYVKMDKRYSEVQPPDILLLDMKEASIRKQLKGHLSPVLHENIQKTVEQGDQAILFINRRGFAPFIQCQQCGWVVKCRHCDISLTYHKSSKKLRCHYCDYQQGIPSSCGFCGGNQLLMKGFGTEKIEDDIAILFHGIQTLRMDIDSTRNRKSFEKIIHAFEKGEASILIGTQMVTKGLDFEKVKLVGILNADQMLSYPDFRAEERSVQLMMQVSGRAGRRDDRGKVYIQTFNPNHPVFQYIISNDYDGFCLSQFQERNNFRYPPFYRLIQLTLKSKDLNLLIKGSEVYANRLKRFFGERLNGPVSPPVMKIRNEFIFNILLKLEKNPAFLQKAKKTILEETGKFNLDPDYRKIRCIIDVDPI